MDEKQVAIHVLKEELMTAYLEAGKKQREVILEQRKFRTQTPLATITILTVVTPFAKEYAQFQIIFICSYVLLFLSTILGLIGIEGILRADAIGFAHFQQKAAKIRKELKATKDVFKALNEFVKDDEKYWWSNISNHLSEWSIRLFILGLILLFISVFPYDSLKIP